MTIRDDDSQETLYESPGYHLIAGLIRSKDPQICGHHCCGPCSHAMRQAAQAKERLRAEAEQEIREAAKAKAEQERLEEEQKAEEERF